MTISTTVDAETVVATWVKDLIADSKIPNHPKVYLSPSNLRATMITVMRVGGAPTPVRDRPRIRFNIIGSDTPSAKAMMEALVREVLDLNYVSTAGSIKAAEIVNWFTLPLSEIPDESKETRYVLDAIFTLTA